MEKFQKMNREEMKKVMGGNVAPPPECGGNACNIDTDCSGDCYTCQGVTATSKGKCTSQL